MKHLLRSTMLAAAVLLPVAAMAGTARGCTRAGAQRGLARQHEGRLSGQGFQARAASLAPVVDSSYNLPEVEKNSVGFFWATLPPAQQQQVAAAFEKFTVASYASEFSKYSGETITLLPAEKLLGASKIVETQIVPADGSAPTRLDYVVANGPQGWQITDVLLNGTISQVAVHSSDFSSLVSSGDASPLIAALEKKTATLASSGS